LEAQHLVAHLRVGHLERRQLSFGGWRDLVVAADEERAEGSADLAGRRSP